MKLSRTPTPADAIDSGPLASSNERAQSHDVVRCECRKCGAHCNALAAPGLLAICPNCGDSRLVPIEGAEVMAPRMYR